jgi:hypothetical protein
MNEDMSFVTAGNYGARNYGSKSVSAERGCHVTFSSPLVLN